MDAILAQHFHIVFSLIVILLLDLLVNALQKPWQIVAHEIVETVVILRILYYLDGSQKTLGSSLCESWVWKGLNCQSENTVVMDFLGDLFGGILNPNPLRKRKQ